MVKRTTLIPRSCFGSALSPKGLGRIIVFDPTNDPKATKGGIRIALVDHQLVVKLFDTVQGEKYSVKLWTGATLDQVAVHWRMYPRKGDLTNQEFDLLCEALTHWIAKAKQLSIELVPGLTQKTSSCKQPNDRVPHTLTLKGGIMESAPCRSCKHFDERSFDAEIQALEGTCEKGIIAKSFSVYGAASDAEGQLICASYKYQNNFW